MSTFGVIRLQCNEGFWVEVNRSHIVCDHQFLGVDDTVSGTVVASQVRTNVVTHADARVSSVKITLTSSQLSSTQHSSSRYAIRTIKRFVLWQFFNEFRRFSVCHGNREGVFRGVPTRIRSD